MSPADGAAEARRIIFDEAEEVRLEPPRPLMRELAPADPFPVDALGSVLGAAAQAIHDRVQAPMAICGQSVLAAANLAAQGHADIELPIGNGSARPISSFFISVAATGERKSASDAEATWPVRKHEKRLRDEYDPARLDYLNDKAAWDKAREKAMRVGKGDREVIKTALDALGPPPNHPLVPMQTCPEPTFEGLCRLFADGLPSLGIFAAEGGQFIGGHGMKDDDKLKTAAGMCGLWDGESIRRVRGGDGVSNLPGRRLAVHLMAQPGVADFWFRDRLLADQGLMSRMLITAPDSAAGTRFSREERPETDRDIKRYGARLLDILETPLPLAPGTVNELQPPPLRISSVSRRIWFGFADRVETALGDNGEYASIRGLANKLAEHAARLAAVLTLVDDIRATDIAPAEMANGIVLAQHYAAEAIRLFGTSQIGGDLRLAENTRHWMLQRWCEPAISLPDFYQFGPNAIRHAATAKKVVALLEEHGWLFKLTQGAVVGGVRRRDAWRIVRS